MCQQQNSFKPSNLPPRAHTNASVGAIRCQNRDARPEAVPASESAHGNTAQCHPTPAPQAIPHFKLTLKWTTLGEQGQKWGKRKQRKKISFCRLLAGPPSFINTKHKVYTKLVKQINKVKWKTHWGARRISKTQQEMHFGLLFVLIRLLNPITSLTPNLHQKAPVHSFKTWCH